MEFWERFNSQERVVKLGLFFIIVFIVGFVIGLRVMHYMGECESGKPVFRSGEFFEKHSARAEEEERLA